MFITRLTLCTTTLLAHNKPSQIVAFQQQRSFHRWQHHQPSVSASVPASVPVLLVVPVIQSRFGSSILTTTRKMSSSTAEEGSKKRVLVPIADDSEEIETTCITDVLTRFGADVVIASVKPDGDLVCKMSRGIKVMADVTIEEAAKHDWDLIALPGGMPGAEYLRDSAPLIELLKTQQQQKKLYGAVCASPAVVLASKGLLVSEGGATCYPAGVFRDVIANASDDSVVVQDNVVTSQGPGTSLLFALSLGEQLFGKEEADKVAAALLVKR